MFPRIISATIFSHYEAEREPNPVTHSRNQCAYKETFFCVTEQAVDNKNYYYYQWMCVIVVSFNYHYGFIYYKHYY